MSKPWEMTQDDIGACYADFDDGAYGMRADWLWEHAIARAAQRKLVQWLAVIPRKPGQLLCIPPISWQELCADLGIPAGESDGH